MSAQIKCPKCAAMRFNVHSSELTTGKVECSNCGHVWKLKLPLKEKEFTKWSHPHLIPENPK